MGYRVRGKLLVSWVVLWTSSAALAMSGDDIRARGVLRVGMSGDYAPFCVCAESTAECKGFEIEVARRLAHDLGVRLEIVRFRWPELRQNLEAGKFDLAMSGVTIRPERLLFAAFTRPYAVAGAVALIDDVARFSSVATVNQTGVRVAVNAGGHLEQVARGRFPEATILPVPRNLELPTMVENRQADALLTDSFEAPQFLASHGRLSALPAFGRDRKAYIVRRSDGALRDWLDTWLAERERDGFLPGLRRQWLGQNNGRPLSLLASVFTLLDLRLALMPAVADYKQRHALPIEDLAQETAVVEQVRSIAREKGKNPEALGELFRVQIDLAKQVQHFMLRDPSRIPTWAHGLNLTSELRPVLSGLGDHLIDTLTRLPPSSFPQDTVVQMAEEEITAEGIAAAERRRLGEAIWRVLTDHPR